MNKHTLSPTVPFKLTEVFTWFTFSIIFWTELGGKTIEPAATFCKYNFNILKLEQKLAAMKKFVYKNLITLP